MMRKCLRIRVKFVTGSDCTDVQRQPVASLDCEFIIMSGGASGWRSAVFLRIENGAGRPAGRMALETNVVLSAGPFIASGAAFHNSGRSDHLPRILRRIVDRIDPCFLLQVFFGLSRFVFFLFCPRGMRGYPALRHRDLASTTGRWRRLQSTGQRRRPGR